MNEIKIKRVYEEFNINDGYRILVDRLWPRGIKKENLKLDYWEKEIAPSSELRKFFNHEPDKFQDFSIQYIEELNNNNIKGEFLDRIKGQLKNGNITFLYGAKDKEYNQAVVLKKWVEDNI